VKTLIIVSYVAGAIPCFLLLWEYGFKTRWETSAAGRALFALFVIVAANYVLQLGTSLAPGFFHSWFGVAIRVGVRLAIAAAMWNMYRVFRKAQRVNRREQEGGTNGESR
jgi:FtsH-binding integral membrane protein